MTNADRAAFLAERKKGIGGSDIASVFNVGYGCRRRLWYDKTETPEDFPRETTTAMELGNVLEPYFAQKYSEATKRLLSQSASMTHLGHPGLRVNLDRLIITEMAQSSGAGVLEIKSVGRAMFYKIKREGLPEDYIMQLQHGMLVAGTTWGSFAIGSRDSGELLWWDVQRSEAICAEILAEAPKFWQAVTERGPTPPGLSPDDRRCQPCEWRTTCQGEALVNIGPQSDYERDESLAGLIAEHEERRALRKEAEDLLDEAKEELKARMGARGMVEAHTGKVQFYEIEKKAYTVAAHKERPLRVYGAKGKK